MATREEPRAEAGTGVGAGSGALAGGDVGGPGTDPDATDRTVARRVTFGAVGLLLVVALVQVELWPLTAYRLFSQTRDADRVSTRLVAELPNGSTRALVPGATNPVLRTTTHQYARLRHAGPVERAQLSHAWLAAAGAVPDDVVALRLERVRQRLDAGTLRWADLGTETLVTMPLSVSP